MIAKSSRGLGIPYEVELAPLTEEDFAGDNLDIIPSLMIQLMRYETAIDGISQGVCFYDGDQKLVLSNRRYAEIYGLDPEMLQPGMSLEDVVNLRQKAGSCPSSTTQEYLSWCDSVNNASAPSVWNAELKDGRTIRVCHQSLEDNGWVSTHDDISDKLAHEAIDKERLSLQYLIDAVPDYMWLKDTDHRFIVANKALANDWGKSDSRELLGLSDDDFHSPELAKVFKRSEAEIIASRTPMVGHEEFVLDKKGGGKWLSSTKIPLLDDNQEVFAIVGIARDITARKHAEEFRAQQAAILELIANRAPLSQIMAALCALLELKVDGMHATVLLENAKADTCLVGNVVSAAAAEAIANAAGIGLGSQAANVDGKIIVADFHADARWADCREVIAEFGFHSCWLVPIVAKDGTVSGTLMLFSASMGTPTDAEDRVVQLARSIAAVAINAQ